MKHKTPFLSLTNAKIKKKKEKEKKKKNLLPDTLSQKELKFFKWFILQQSTYQDTNCVRVCVS